MQSSKGAQQLVSQIVKLLDTGIERAAANASRFEEKTGVTTLNTLAKATAPSALVLSKLAGQIEHKSAQLASKIAADDVATASVKRTSAFSQKRTAKTA